MKQFLETMRIDEQTLPVIAMMAEGMPGGFFIYHADGNEELIYYNRSMMQLFGCETDIQFRALTGNSFPGMIYASDVAAIERSIHEQIQANEKHEDHVEYRIRRRDGEIRWVTNYGRFLHTENMGDIFFVFINDSTEKQMELTRQRQVYTVANGLSRDYNAVYVLDFNTEIMTPFAVNNKISKNMVPTICSGLGYDIVMAEYAFRYVSLEDRELFLQLSTIENIQNNLKKDPFYHFSFRRYNEMGDSECIQMTAAEIEDDPERIIIGFKPINDVLFNIHTDLNLALRSVYMSTYYIDIEHSSGYIVFNRKRSQANSSKIEGDIQEFLYSHFKPKIVRQDLQRVMDFLDLSTLKNRLKGRTQITLDYMGIMDGIRICPIHMDIFVLTHTESKISTIMLGINEPTEKKP